MPRTLHHPAAGDVELTAVLHALSDPVRLQIVRTLAVEDCGSRSGGAIALPVTKSTTTHHFRVLREQRRVEQRAEGTALVTTPRRDELDARFPLRTFSVPPVGS